MCGVGAVVARGFASVSESSLRQVQKALTHRGPDGCGLYLDQATPGSARYGLAHTRLAVLDLSEAAAQPMNHAEGIHLSYNGEIYNFLELADELRGLGHLFVSHGDTEVLLAAYREWGIGCLDRLVGMFSFVLVDERTDTLLAARDPFGIKPLYYSNNDLHWVFASEIKAVRAVLPSRRRADMESVLRYLRFGSTDGSDSTMFEDIKQLPAGHYLTARLQDPQPKVKRYFDLKIDPLSAASLSFEEAADHLRDLLETSVALHLRSDVTVGAALSGGLDSSSIVSLIPRVAGNADLHCFTYAAAGTSLDESGWASIVARQAGAELHLTAPGSEDLMARMVEVTRSMDEPLPSTSTFAQYCVFELARKVGVKVLLDGQGADELLAGYDRYVAARVASLVRAGRFGPALNLARHASARGIRVGRTLTAATEYFVPDWSETWARHVVRRPLLPQVVDPDAVAGYTVRRSSAHSRRTRDRLRDRLYADLTADTLPALLRYEDRNSMAWSIESRVPFLTPAIASFCLSLPESYLVSADGVSKAVLRKAMRGVVPDTVIDRTDKIGFAPPAQDWMRQRPAFARSELERAAERLPFIAKDRLLSETRGTRRVRTPVEQLWRVIFLSTWTSECDVSYD